MMQEVVTFKPGEIWLEPADIFRLMHMENNKNQEPFASIIAREVEAAASSRGVQGGYRLIEEVELDDQSELLMLGGERFQAGRQVISKLKGSEVVALFICTAGGEVGKRIQKLTQEGDTISAYVADVIGSVLVEEAMDRIHKTLFDRMQKQGWKVTNRYSPGYCDWNVSEQQALFRLLPDNFCGVTLTESMLMLPVKSVSGIIGAGGKVKYQRYICHSCSSVNCIYRDVKQRKTIG